MATSSRVRYLRRRKFLRLTADQSGLLRFIQRQSARLVPTVTPITFTADAATDNLSATAHGFSTGQPVVVTNSGGALPAGLAASTVYFVIRIDANTFRLARTRQLAAAGTQIDITTNGTGTQTAARQATNSAIFELLRRGRKFNTIRAGADIDTL